MKISQQRLEENRQNLLDAAARLLREQGCDKVGIADVTKAAGLTHGAFYNHFSSKDDMITKVFVHVMLAQPEEDMPSSAGLEAFIHSYLTREHVDNRATGCMYAAFAGEIFRLPSSARGTLTQALTNLITRLSQHIASPDEVERRRIAITKWSTMLGGLILARAVDDPALSDEILNGVLQSLSAD